MKDLLQDDQFYQLNKILYTDFRLVVLKLTGWFIPVLKDCVNVYFRNVNNITAWNTLYWNFCSIY